MFLQPFVEIPLRDARGNILMDPRTGRPVMGVTPNPIKDHVRGFHIKTDPEVVTLTPFGTAGDSAELLFKIDSQGHFDWAYFLGTSQDQFFITFEDPGRQTKLQNRPILSNNIMGSGQRPYRLPEPYFFDIGDSDRQLTVKIRNIAAVNNEIRMVLYGRRFYHKEAQPDIAIEMNRRIGAHWRTAPYWMMPKEFPTNDNTLPTAVPGLGTTVFTFVADDEFDTDLHKFTAFSNGAFEFTLREKDTNRLISNGQMLNTFGWGTAQFPYHLCDTLFLERRKELQMQVTDLSGTTNLIMPCIAGRRLHL